MLSGIIIAGLVFAAAATGSTFKPGEWYAGLNKPSWTPPNWAFPVVWAVLYCMIAYSGWLIWGVGAVIPIILWGLQLILNALWSYFFFGLKNMKLALIDVSFLVITTIIYIVFAYPASELAAYLFIPYVIWVFTAAMLNLRVIQLNN